MSYVRQTCKAFTLAMTVAMSLATPAWAADMAEYTLRSSADEVRLAFSACDRQGHAITQLNPRDVAVVDNGAIIRKFRSFRSAAESPVNLVVLLDASDSVATQIPREIEEVKRFVAGNTWGAEDHISIIAFGGSQPELICVRSCDSAEAQQDLSDLRASGSTPLYDALVAGSAMLEANHNPEARNAMVVFSDGVDTISMHGLGDAVDSAQQAEAQIYTVNSGAAQSAAEGDRILSRMAQASGGLSFARGQNTDAALKAVLLDLHAGFVLAYELPQQISERHWVRVLPTIDPKLQLRSRQGYRGGHTE